MIDITPTLFVGDPSDARQSRVKSPGISTISLSWTSSPTEALAVIGAGGSALLPRDNWKANATDVLAALGCSAEWIARCLRMADYHDITGDPSAAINPG